MTVMCDKLVKQRRNWHKANIDWQSCKIEHCQDGRYSSKICFLHL